MAFHTQPIAGNDTREKLWDMIDGIKTAMLVTQGLDGHLFARPMMAQERDGQDRLWFFTNAASPKVSEIEHYSNVLLSYADTKGNTFVSIAGEAKIVREQQKIDQYWSEGMKAWFPKGKDDPDIALICVTPLSAEYWDAPSSKFVQAFGYIKAKVTGEVTDMGENKTVGL